MVYGHHRRLFIYGIRLFGSQVHRLLLLRLVIRSLVMGLGKGGHSFLLIDATHDATTTFPERIWI